MSTPTISKQDTLQDISPVNVGFHALNGDKKAKILPSPWTSGALPPSYASILSVASAHGFYAAASPDGVLIGKTQTVRDAIYASTSTEPSLCEPLNTISLTRPSHVAFAADESCLVTIGEKATELHAYSTSSISAEGTKPAVTLQLPAPLRALVPNPDRSQARYFALVTTDKQLLIADIEQEKLIAGQNGSVLAENVVCVAWSNKGKQLIAGRDDATAVQITPDGFVKCTFPKPESVPANCHLAQVVWIENNVFFFNYTPDSASELGDVISEQYIVHTDKDRSDLTLQKSNEDLFFPVVEEGRPAQFLAVRLRAYAPSLDEVIFLASTIAPEIVTITKASQPLDPDTLDEGNTYTITKPMDDQRWAALPFDSASSQDTYPVGLAIDLSDDLPIIKPIPSDSDIEHSSSPVPELLALNAQGVLTYWAFIYEDAIRQNKSYPGFEDLKLITASSESSLASPVPTQVETPKTATKSPHVESAFASTTPKPAGFGSGSAFGQTTPITKQAAPSWTSEGFGNDTSSSSPAFGQAPAFGSTPALGQSKTPAFGTQGALGANLKATTGPAFGQPGFGQTSSNTNRGFGGFASQGGFGTASTATPTSAFGSGGGFGASASTSSFAKSVAGSSGAFGSNTSTSIFGTNSNNNAFGKATPIGGSSKGQSLTTRNKGFQLQSTFEKDETSNDVNDEDDDSGKSFGFGGSLGNMLTRKPQETSNHRSDKAMDNDEDNEIAPTDKVNMQKTPPATLSQPKNHATPPVSSLFGSLHPTTTPLTNPQTSNNVGWGFAPATSTTPKDTPAPNKMMFGTQSITDTTPAAVQLSKPSQPFSFTNISNAPSDSDRVKSLASDDDSEEEEANDSPNDAPLPPDPFSKPPYQQGDTSASSLASRISRDASDAPLPPDFMITKTKSSLEQQASSIQSDMLSDDFDGSGEDVTGDVSPVEAKESHVFEDNVETSPESSFGQGTDRSRAPSPPGGAFTNIKVEQSKSASRPLFGELEGPIFAPPVRKDDSPRSPSPMRKPARHGALARSPERSVSAPAHRGSLIAQRKQDHQQSAFAIQAAQAEKQEAELAQLRREKDRRAKEDAKAAQLQVLEDDEDEALRQELEKSTQPKESLDPFVAILPGKALQGMNNKRNDVPAQIEVLYQDINSMIATLGINAKSVSAFMMYQSSQEDYQSFPDILVSDTPLDVLNDEWLLSDIAVLKKGQHALAELVDAAGGGEASQILDQCSELLTKDISNLRDRIKTLIRSTQARMQQNNSAEAKLSAEQSAVQYELRKTSASVFSNLSQLEDQLGILRAKLADLAPPSRSDGDMLTAMQGAAKRPSVEAIMSTITKMTAMAEKRSADVDFLESQLRKLDIRPDTVIARPRTPERQIQQTLASLGSGRSSVFYTPGSNRAKSRTSTPSRGVVDLASAEDRSKWQAKARRKKEISHMLRSILTDKTG